MKHNGLSNKKILIVSERTDIRRMLEDPIRDGLPKCRIDRVKTVQEACRAIMLIGYHLIIIDESKFKNMSHPGLSPMQNFPLLVLTDNDKLSAEQKNSPVPNVYGHLPADRPEVIISMLPRILNNGFVPRWQVPFKRHGGIFNLGTIEAAEKLFKFTAAPDR